MGTLNLELILDSINSVTLSLIALAIIHGLFAMAFKQREKTETLCNIGIYFGYFFVKHFLTVGLSFGSLSLAYKYRLFEIPATIFNFLICIIVADFLYYWKHRLEHRSRILWAAHSVHHSSTEFNLSTSLRLPWLTPFYAWIVYLPVAALGFPPLMVLSAVTIVLGYQFLIHTQRIGRLGLLDHILNTPSNHRVHHGSNKEYLDRNYGGIFIFWDKLFGSFALEDSPVVYGLTKPINTANPVRVNTIEVEHMIHDIAQSKKPREALKIIFNPPS